MDFITLIREQRDQFSLFRDPDGINAVLKHLDAAIKHFQAARLQGDAELFTDVVYRSNQVFEGILKEAYAVLAGKAPEKKKPFDIEKFFTDSKIFRPKVLDYFTRYRTDWRNASTHDYRIDFDEQEAFLAIATVSAFCFVAITQMLQKLAAETAAAASKPVAVPSDYLTLAATIVAELPDVIRSLLRGATLPSISETILEGALAGLVNKIWPGGTVQTDFSFEFEGQTVRPDLVWQAGPEKLVFEVKATRDVSRAVGGPAVREQLACYAHAIGASGAIAIIVPRVFLHSHVLVFGTEHVHNAKVPTLIIYPVQS